MGKLIDADELLHCDCKGSFSECDTCLNSELCSLINDAQTIEAIPKADYEARLKADMVAMLTDIQLEIEEKKFLESNCTFMDKTEEKNYAVYTDDISKVIQQKIDSLKAESEE